MMTMTGASTVKPPRHATKLWHWMWEKKVTLAKFAERLDVTPGYLSDVRRGKLRPSDPLKAKIEIATGGDVKVADWFGGRDQIRKLAKS